jgi:hypothetical protein
MTIIKSTWTVLNHSKTTISNHQAAAKAKNIFMPCGKHWIVQGARQMLGRSWRALAAPGRLALVYRICFGMSGSVLAAAAARDDTEADDDE